MLFKQTKDVYAKSIFTLKNHLNLLIFVWCQSATTIMTEEQKDH